MNKQLKLNKDQLLTNALDKLKPYRFAFFLVASSFFVMLFSPFLTELLRYESDLVNSGQWWRILTANICHSNWNHWLLNMLGLLIMDFFLKPVISEKLRVTILLVSMLGSVLFLHLFLKLTWYVGLSGALHGYIFAGAIISWRTAKKINALILFIVMTKVVVENFWEINQSTEKLIGANVIEESHLFGVVAAILFSLIFYLIKKL